MELVKTVRQRWEYLVCTAKDMPEIESKLNSMGDGGWELVSAVLEETIILLFFKRPV
jgi:hypothetical protein